MRIRPGTRVAAVGSLLAPLALVLAQACTKSDVVGVSVGSVSVQPPTATVPEQDSVQLTAIVRDEDGRPLQGAGVSWSSDAPAVLSVGPTGIAYGHEVGSSLVTATFRGVSGSALVAVIAGPTIRVTPDSVVLRAAVGGASPSPASVQVTNGGVGTLSGLSAGVGYPDGGAIGWLDASLTHSTAPTDLTLAAITPLLPVGWHRATVHLSPSGAESRIVELPVVLSVAGLTISRSGLAVDEAGSTATLSVRPDLAPASDVVLVLSVSDPGEATVSPTTIRFTPQDWGAPKTATVTGVDDLLVDGAQESTLTVSVDRARSDPAYAPIEDRIIQITTHDDDSPGLAIAESAGATVVSESGTTDDFTVVLTARPASDVVVEMVSANPAEVVVTPERITFTPAGWSAPRTVTLIGVDDEAIDGNQTTRITVSVDEAASDDEFDGVEDRFVDVVTLDDDQAGFTVGHTGGSTSALEGGATDTLEVRLTAPPLSDVVLDVSVDDPSDAAVDDPLLTFTEADWSTPRAVVFRAVDDQLADGTRARTVTVSANPASDPSFASLPPQSVVATTLDDEVPGFTVLETNGGTAATEGGAHDTIRVALDVRPVSNVVFDVGVDDEDDAAVSPTTLAFTTTNWSIPQVVTFRAVDDPVTDGTQARVITVAVDPTSHAVFTGLPAQEVQASTVDNESIAVIVAHTNGSTESAEGGASDSISVTIGGQPLADVILDFVVDDSSDASVTPASLTFPGGTPATPRWVTFLAIDDVLLDGDGARTITISVGAGSDPSFLALADVQIAATTLDTDVADIVVTQSGEGTAVAEAGGTDDFTVALTVRPATNVVFEVTVEDADEVSASPASLVFTPADWDQPQVVTVTGVDDDIGDGDQVTAVNLSVDDGSDAAFLGMSARTVDVTTLDDDPIGFAVAPTGGTTVGEDGAQTATLAVQLVSLPVDDVTLTVTSGNPSEAEVLPPTTLTFTTANGTTPQLVTVTGEDDEVADGNAITTISVAVDHDATLDPAYDTVSARTVDITTLDDEVAGFTLSTLALSVSEAVTTAELTAVLDAQPVSNVVLSFTSADLGEATVSPAMLTFTPATWSTPQTVTVTGQDDDADDGDQVTLVTIAVVDDASHDAFHGVSDQTVSVTTLDDDVAGFTITETDGSTSVTEGGTTDTFTLVLTARPSSSVTLTITSADTGEATVSHPSVTFPPGQWASPRTITVTAVDDAEADGDRITLVTVAVDPSSDAAFLTAPDQQVSVTTVDNDFDATLSSSGSSPGRVEDGADRRR